MIKFIEKENNDFLNFCNRDVFGTRIKAYFNCYSTDYDFVKFWLQYDEKENVTAAFSRIDGDFTISCDNADAEEIREFLKIVGYRTVQCNRRLAQCLELGEPEQGFVVRWKEKSVNSSVEIKKHFELKEIYDIIKKENLTGVGELMPWLSDVTYRVNRGCAEGVIGTCDGENAGCAMVLFRTDCAALLGAVATRPEFRGKGIAGSLVSMLAESEHRNGRRVELLCKNGTIVEFYKKIGFETADEWGLIKNDTEIF